MRALRPPTRDDSATFLPTLVANLLPLVGVLRFGWEPATLVFVYAAEVLVSLLVASGKALFAQRRPTSDREAGVLSVSDALLTAKRGGVRPVTWLPPIPVRNVSFALVVLYVTPVYAFFVGIYLHETFDAGMELFRAEVLLSVVALFVGQLVAIGRDYLGRRRYERTSPYAVVETPARRVFFLAFVLTVGPAVGSTGALALVVCAKLLLEWATFRATRDEGDSSRLADWFVVSPASADTDEDGDGAERAVRVPDVPPRARLRPDRSLVVRKGTLRALARIAGGAPLFGLLWLAVVSVLASATGSSLVVPVGAAALVAAVLLAFGVQLAAYFLRYGTLEYRRYDEAIVAYDTFLEEPQWAAPVQEIRDVTVATDWFDERLLGAGRLRLTVGWDDDAPAREIGPVRDVIRVAEALEIPSASKPTA